VIATNHAMPENLLEFSPIPHPAEKLAVRMWWRDADRIFSRAEVMTSPTRRAADFVQENTSIKTVLAISCGLDSRNYKARFGERSENLIVFVGRVTSEKQIDKLIRAFALLEPDLDARLEIVGGGELVDDLKELATRLGVADRVQFDGYVTNEFLRAALTRATVFAMPSIAELQSIATLEALASGLPVVAARAMALPHLVHDGENGFLFEPGDVAAFAARLTDILTMPQRELRAFKRESLRIVRAHDIGHTIATFEQIYRGHPVIEPLIEESLPRHHFMRERIVRARKRVRAGARRLRVRVRG
jgi:glycosyltransferase involved in cell wall biosynthesis